MAGILSGNTEEPVNLVNAPQMAEERGIELVETKDASAEDFTELVTVRVHSGDGEVEVAGTSVGPRNEPYLVSAWGESFYLPFAEHISVFRYADQPGMIGRVGTMFGEEGVNIVSAAVGAESGGEQAVMALTTDARAHRTVEDPWFRWFLRWVVRRRLGWVDESGRVNGDGWPEVLKVQERPDPAVGPGEVRIAVRAAGINFADTMARVGLYPDAPKTPCVLGYEVAGEIESVGEGVEDRQVGERVMAGTRFGGQAELVSVPTGQVLPLPERLSFEQGAAFPVNYGTAYAALILMGGLRAGDRLLIHAAAGGVGIAAARSPATSAPTSSAPPRRPSTRRSSPGISHQLTTAARTSRPR